MAYTRLEKKNKIAVVWLDQEGETVNKLGAYIIDEFTALFNELQQDDEVEAVVFISGKKDSFIAGADLDYLLDMDKEGSLASLSRQGQAMMDRIAGFPKPVVAAIHGAALGGGLEMALACHYRLATEHPKTVLGLPEVKLGLLPASGGTQRLPRLVGLTKALNLMLTGKNIYPRQARKIGLVNDLIHPHGLLDAALQAARNLADGQKVKPKKRSFMDRSIDRLALTRKMAYQKAREAVQRQTRGNYPAPVRIIESVSLGLEKGIPDGLKAESAAFEALVRSPQARELIALFFAMNSKKKNPFKDKVRKINSLGILGAGLMGAGIAEISIHLNMDVWIKDVSPKNLGTGERQIYRGLQKKVKRRIISSFQRDEMLSRLHGTLDYPALENVAWVIEAVFEDLALKQHVLKEVESIIGDRMIFASNTSSLPIADIARAAKRPEQVIGMHYFSPVPKMPLLEIIVTPRTAKWVTATAVEIGIRQGKIPIVVNDGPGFYTTRILTPMLNEALLLLEAGGDIQHIDTVMKNLGFPVGPLTLIDEVGIDVGVHVGKVLSDMFAARGVVSGTTMQTLLEAGFKGRKNKKGFYLYPENTEKRRNKRKKVNPAIYRFLGGAKRQSLDDKDIQERLLLIMIGEALRCLEEGILHKPVDGDVGAVLGLGFPPFLGGPFRYVDRTTPAILIGKMEQLESKYGARFSPPSILRDYADRNIRFYK